MRNESSVRIKRSYVAPEHVLRVMDKAKCWLTTSSCRPRQEGPPIQFSFHEWHTEVSFVLKDSKELNYEKDS